VLSPTLFHLLQVSDVLDTEFGSALAERVPVLGWTPQRTFMPLLIPQGSEPEAPYAPQSGLRLRSLPLMRGFSRAPIRWFANTGPTVRERLLKQTSNPSKSVLICTTPHFASVAEQWPGPVVYWLTDLIAEYASSNRKNIEKLDRRLCRVATLVCPNSHRIADYLVEYAGCDRSKIHIVPNATRASNILAEAPSIPGPKPDTIADVDTPIAGVIGNLAGNMDWVLLQKMIDQLSWLTMVFVGPTSMAIQEKQQRVAREAVISHPRSRFVGKKPYGDLAAYARAFDVAILPYKRREPTYSGSSTRFYEHLAACRPMIATRGFEELTRRTEFLTPVDSAEAGVQALENLRNNQFDDGLLKRRWVESKSNTWQTRAASMQNALADRLNKR
jgi:glycosyltransferase involved in cell wall biosynthesis